MRFLSYGEQYSIENINSYLLIIDEDEWCLYRHSLEYFIIDDILERPYMFDSIGDDGGLDLVGGTKEIRIAEPNVVIGSQWPRMPSLRRLMLSLSPTHCSLNDPEYMLTEPAVIL